MGRGMAKSASDDQWCKPSSETKMTTGKILDLIRNVCVQLKTIAAMLCKCYPGVRLCSGRPSAQ